MRVLLNCGLVTWVATVALLSLGPGRLSAKSHERDHVLIFAPAEFSELNKVEYFSRGGAALQRQFLNSGFAPNNVMLLSGKSATVDRFRQELDRLNNEIGVDELIFVAVASHGVQVRGVDYVCGANTSVHELRKLHQADDNVSQPATVVSVQEIIEKMSLSASSKRFLLVDTAVSRDPIPRSDKASRNLADRFGNQPVQVADKLWVTCSRSGRLDTNGTMTCFMRSVIDGLTGHADEDGDGQVSVFEISDYLRTFAQAAGYTPPLLHARAKVDYVLAAATEARQSLRGLPADLQDRLGRAMLEVGKTSLLVDGDTKTAINALEQAAQLAASQEVKQESERFLLTAMASNGDIAAAWNKAQQHDLPLLVVTQIPTRVYQAPEPIRYLYRWNDTLEPKVILKVSEMRGEEWFGFGKSYQSTENGGFRPIPEQNGWIRTPEFPLETGAANRL